MIQTELAEIHSQYRHRLLSNATQHRDALIRLAWKGLMSVYHLLSYHPIWQGRPMLVEKWRQMPVTVPHLPELSRVLPTLSLSQSAGLSCDAQALAHLLHQALVALNAEGSTKGTRRFTPPLKSYQHWKQQVSFKNSHVVDQMTALSIPCLRALLLQGSLSDGHIVEGFSDCDVIAILGVPADPESFCDQVSSVIRLNHFLLAYNPIAHHGPFIYFEGALANTAEAVLPSAILSQSTLLAGEGFTVGYSDGDLEAGEAIASFENYFDVRFNGGPEKIRTSFDALWWISTATLLPCLEYQLANGESIWKRDLLPNLQTPLIKALTKARLALGAWMERRKHQDDWPLQSELNPGVCMAAARDRFPLTDDDRAEIGIDQSMLNAGRTAMRSLASRAAIHGVSRLLKANATKLSGWPEKLEDYPQPLPPSEYDDLRHWWLSLCRAHRQVRAVYEFGSIGCPGLSDLDLLLVMEDQGDRTGLSIDALPKYQRDVMVHNPVVVPLTAAPFLAKVLPLFSLRHLQGDILDLPLAKDLPHGVVAAALTAYNRRKYPDDLHYQVGQSPGSFRILLAYLHSFSHVRQMFLLMGVTVPTGVEACCETDHELRAQFRSAGGVESGVLPSVMGLMLQASQEMDEALEAYWKSQLPDLWAVAGSEADSAEDHRSAFLDWIGAYLADPDLAPAAESTAVREMLLLLEPYRQAKREFLTAMRLTGFPSDAYLVDPRFSQDPLRVTRRMEMEGGDWAHAVRCDLFNTLSFGAGERGARALGEGWSQPEAWGTWTVGSRSSLKLSFPSGSDLVLVLTGRSFVTPENPAQRVRLFVNSSLVAEWLFVDSTPRALPPVSIRAGSVGSAGRTTIRFECPDARSPQEYGISDDSRKLGFGLSKLELSSRVEGTE